VSVDLPNAPRALLRIQVQTSSKISEKADRIARAESPFGKNIFVRDTDFFLDSPARQKQSEGQAKADNLYAFQRDSSDRITLLTDKTMPRPALCRKAKQKALPESRACSGWFYAVRLSASQNGDGR